MIKTFLFLSLLLFMQFANSQAPAGYYNSASGLTGYPLKTALKNIITSGHINQGYGSLYSAYQSTDNDSFYENDNSVLDMYSENPNGVDSYFYNHNTNTCGNYSGENDCYNREHLIPQSIFSSASPMQADVHFVVPTDGYVNGQRSNLPFGEVDNPSWTSLNGSKKGGNVFPGGYTSAVFEPIDEFKGDIARCLLYFATRYESNVTGWNYNGVLNGTSNQVYTDWFLNLLLTWNAIDSVSPREIARNNACYTYQGNRNPFIDSAQYVNLIWGDFDTIKPTTPLNLTVSDISTDSAVLTWNKSNDLTGIEEYAIFSSVFQIGSSSDTTNIMYGLLPNTAYSFYVKAKDSLGNYSLPSDTVHFTTFPSLASINENKFESLKIYPNPTNTGTVTITFDNSIDGIEVYSVVGKRIKDVLLKKEDYHRVSLMHLRAGVFFVKLKSGESSITKKIVVER